MIVDDSIFVDKNSYDKIWEIVISPTIKEYQSTFSEIILANNAKEVIWEEYVRLNKYCKNHYMQDNAGKLDRHKVCACYMYAIMQANVLDCRLAGSDTERSYLALNENLAITVGMSVLTAFIKSSINNNEMSQQEKAVLMSRIDSGIKFPECNHGNYRNNFVSELHYTHEERNYNILSLANTLFLLETHTLQTEAIYKQTKSQ